MQPPWPPPKRRSSRGGKGPVFVNLTKSRLQNGHGTGQNDPATTAPDAEMETSKGPPPPRRAFRV
jgi:hypothetical protein